jgi:hypothetical protein
MVHYLRKFHLRTYEYFIYIVCDENQTIMIAPHEIKIEDSLG